jgi:hypothetical protein
MQDFLKALHVREVDQSELELVIQSHFQFAQAPNPYEVRYGPHDPYQQHPPALVVRYSKSSGRISKIEPGPTLCPDDIAQIAEKVRDLLLGATEYRIGQTILFSVLPLNGWFRYGDSFQLIPVPAEASRPPVWAVGGFPLLMQYRFAGSPDPSLQSLRRFNAGRELELLCTALSQHIEGSIPPVIRYHWFTVASGDPPQQRAEFAPEGYSWPGFGGIASEYASVDGRKLVPRLSHQDYYRQVGISVGQEMALPDSFEQLLTTYFGRTEEDRDRFIRASYWYQFAARAAGRSNTASYSGLCSAVEALMGPEPTGRQKCEKCGRTTGGGVRQRFREFLEQWAPGPSTTAADRQRLYDLRNMTTHGGRLLHSDRFGWGVALSPSSLEDRSAHFTMARLVQTILVNWLAGARDDSGE